MSNSHFILQAKHDTAANLATANKIPAEAELVLESDTNKFKFGDGETRYNDLPYAGGGTAPIGSFKYGLYTLSANQTSNLAVGNHIEFDAVQGSLGGLSTGTGQEKGIVTLKGGKTYKITCYLNADFPSSSFATYSIYDRTHDVAIGQTGTILSVNLSYAMCGMQPTAMAVVSPGSDINIDVRSVNNTSPAAPTCMEYTATSLLIEEYGGY